MFREENLNDLRLNRIRHDNCNAANSQVLLTVKSNLASSINFSQMVPTLPSLTDFNVSEKVRHDENSGGCTFLHRKIKLQESRVDEDQVEVLASVEPVVEHDISDDGENFIEPRFFDSDEDVQKLSEPIIK